jgi:hypothetical protein
MKKLIFFFCFTNLNYIFGQKMEWIPLIGKEPVGILLTNSYYTPVSVDKLPHKFNLQLDLGAITTVFMAIQSNHI